MQDNELIDYFLDSIEIEETPAPLQDAQPIEPADITPQTIQNYFKRNLYPFETRLDIRSYLKEMHALQIELVKLQNWIKDSGSRLVVVFEGRDAAGKGSTIKRFMEHLNPRGARVVALEKPTEVEQGQWYFQRYADHLPTAGEMVFFDRSWYNRAGVERVMEFCSQADYEEFIRQAPMFEQMLVRSGIKLIKFYLSISREEQARRFAERATNPLKQWKLSPIDKEAQAHWDEYTQAKEEIFSQTDTADAPWVVVKSEDKMRARLEAMRYVLTQFDYAGKSTTLNLQPHPLLVATAATLKAFNDD